MKLIMLLGLAILVSACTVEERNRPYFSRYDNRDVVVLDEPRYVNTPRHHRWNNHHHHDRVTVRY